MQHARTLPAPVQRVPVRPLLGLAVLAFLPLILPNYWVYLATSIIITSVVVLSLGLVTGMAGMVSLCQLSFAGIGGWVVAYLNANHVPVPFAAQILLGGLAAVPFGVLIGLPALRVRGVNLAVVTFGFAAVLDLLFTIINFPGGVTGQPVVRPNFLAPDRAYYWFCLAVFVLVVLAVTRLYRGRLGSAWLAVKHSERATAAMGLGVPSTKLSAFALSAFIAGLGGGLTAGQLGLLSATNFAPVESLVLFAVAVMVGARYPAGAVVAGALSLLVPELLSRLQLSQDFANLLFVVGTIQALRQGGGVFEVNARRRLAAQRGKVKGVSADAHAHAPVVTQPAEPTPVTLPLQPEPALELRDLTVRYGQVTAVDRVSLTVPAGQVVGLIGPNGAGKSSLIDAITGFTRYTGSVRLAGQPIDGLNAAGRARAHLRRSFQQDRTIPDLSVRAYLELSAGRKLPEDELAESLEFAALGDPSLELHSLDVGTRRLLEVIGLLRSRPRVVLLDEPAAGLSVAESRVLGTHIARIPARYDCSVLLVEHDMELVRSACPSVVVLDFGKVIASGPTEIVLARREVVAAYLGEEVA